MRIFFLLSCFLLLVLPAVAQPPQRYSVLITEMMFDPTPAVSLPEAEFIELKNVGKTAVSLAGWRLATTTYSSGAFPPFTLQPDSFLIVTATANAALFSNFGNVLGVAAFPALPNSGGLVTLKSKEGSVIDAVAYLVQWHDDIKKSTGGWTLEMIDPQRPCGGSNNWRSSIAAAGGTPGHINSVDAFNPDAAPPQLLRTYTLGNNVVVAVFNEGMDSAAAANRSSYLFSNNFSVIAAAPIPPLFKEVQLSLNAALQPHAIYQLSVEHLTDCSGNAIGLYSKAPVAIPATVSAGNMVINEILFNPLPGGSDYVELYNTTENVFDVARLNIATRNSAGVLAAVKKISETPFYIFPHQYFVLTPDAANLSKSYFVKHPENVLSIALPGYPNDAGTVVLSSLSGEIIDEVNYSEKWHFPLIANPKGVALERVNPLAPTQGPQNWRSAAATAGYGTPTYQNSQYNLVENSAITFDVQPPVFSPDGDGYDDVTHINFAFAGTGRVANVFIYDAGGKRVKHLVKNETLGGQGSWTWNGLDEKEQRLSIGTYIILMEIFDLNGQRQTFKRTVVLARHLP